MARPGFMDAMPGDAAGFFNKAANPEAAMKAMQNPAALMAQAPVGIPGNPAVAMAAMKNPAALMAQGPAGVPGMAQGMVAAKSIMGKMPPIPPMGIGSFGN